MALKVDASVEDRLNKAWAEAYLERGERLLKLGSDNGTQVRFSMAVRRDPDAAKRITDNWRSTFIDRGSRLLAQKQDNAALNQYALALQHANSDADRSSVHNSIAWGWFQLGRAAEGLADAERAVSLSPDDPNVLDTRGQIYLMLGRADDAFKDFDKAIDKGITSAGTYYGRGRCREIKGNRDAAIADYRAALQQQAKDRYLVSVHEQARKRLAALGVPASTDGDMESE